MISSFITGFLGWFVLMPALYLLGSYAEPFFRRISFTLRGIFYFACGYGFLVFFLILIGTLGLLHLSLIVLFLSVIFIFRRSKIPEFRKWFYNVFQTFFDGQSGLIRLFQFLFLGTALCTFLASFLPEILNDALCNQLNLPKLFIWRHSTTPIYYDIDSYRPLFMNYLYAIGLVIKSVSVAKLFHWWTGFFLFISILLVIYEVTRMRMTSWFLALSFWLTPIFFIQVSTTYVDVAGSFFIFLSLVLILKGIEEEDNKKIWAGGLLAGFAVSTKLILLIGVFAELGLLFVSLFFSRDRKWISKAIFHHAVGCFVGCGFWIVRNWFLYRNPLYPFMGNFFGTEIFELTDHYAKLGEPKSLPNFFLTPWFLIIKNSGFGNWMGPVYLFMTPFVAFGALKNRNARLCLIFCVVYYTLWYFIAQLARYLLAMLPVYLLTGAYGIRAAKNWFSRQAVRKAITPILVVVLIGFVALDLYAYRFQLLSFFKLQSADAYLRQMDRSYSIASWVNKKLPPESRILNFEEIRQFYFERETVRETWFRARTRFDQLPDVKNLAQFLKKEKFTHILKVYAETPSESVNPLLETLLGDSRFAKKIYELESTNVWEERYRYVVYELI